MYVQLNVLSISVILYKVLPITLLGKYHRHLNKVIHSCCTMSLLILSVLPEIQGHLWVLVQRTRQQPC